MGIDQQFVRKFNLFDERKAQSSKNRPPAAHQSRALSALQTWYDKKGDPNGGLLVLPTGGGKTYTALRFLAAGPLSDGCRVIWLAHTHHLLEQAYGALKDSVFRITEPRDTLNARVVSGTVGHFRVYDVRPDDDVLFITLQTLYKALTSEPRQPHIDAFIKGANDKLFVVFDEAHHAPAASYRKLVTMLRDRSKKMGLIGLTATPTYTEEARRGWLKELFPQEILYQVSASDLMKDNVLAKPVFKQIKTELAADFPEHLYSRWVQSNQDLPENVITQLAERRERNAFIAQTYFENKEEFGKTLIFADRWFQCEAIAEMLVKRGVKAEAVYHRVGGTSGDAATREKVTSTHNADALKKFRDGDLEVLVNIRMLTEGTDVPSAKTVFITRQTTSQILVTQMVGRALRGPKFGGTKEANIVSFVDQWKHLINFAEWGEIDGRKDDDQVGGVGYAAHLISIDLVRLLVSQMNKGIIVATGPFSTLLPVGWYVVKAAVSIEGSEDLEPKASGVLVYDNDKDAFESFIKYLEEHPFDEHLLAFEDPSFQADEARESARPWVEKFFDHEAERIGDDLLNNIVTIARHMAQSGVAPKFSLFEERDRHDLDAIAGQGLNEKWDRRKEDEILRLEYNRNDRFWGTLYVRFSDFKHQYNLLSERLLTVENGGSGNRGAGNVDPPPDRPEFEVTDDVRRQVKERDRGVCLACGVSRLLQVDHVISRYMGGTNVLDNLQTLCRTCNLAKGTVTLNFRDLQTDLTSAPSELRVLRFPEPAVRGETEPWEQFLRRTFNWFYRCGAVHSVNIGKRGDGFYHWKVELYVRNPPTWLKPHLGELLRQIRHSRAEMRKNGPDSLTVSCPGEDEVSASIVDQQTPRSFAAERVTAAQPAEVLSAEVEDKWRDR
ncbi:MAG: hypothetical protein AUK47_05805 [Deltaproteobacteria bacterium CG2_30_63_29]|nr:MAG: hypothetical protein AUK47_05805 [Deltaproteobacteria bacterium CG2_30_63_29]